ncbi:terminase TerL endonuclease subunit [Rossellomorea sp. DA94]|uniref:terminase large subunit n=1 Tax=Rossellomorea sp. DA94 TaxID=3038653 RepID=UPI002447C5E9|nr:terminase TerL endonuclease subunit [Rossellomorea sp. DA94]WGG47678.1 terminase large subunit [Rossellomorea sp. DA94]
MIFDRATQYAKDVVEGKKVAGNLEILACKRHLNDLERQGTDEFPYIWSVEKANHIIDFAESLTLAEGEEPAPMKLYPFQCFIFGSWNGWLTLEGHRRFRTSYVQVARQNGKSVGNAVPSMYYGNFAGYQYPQVYATATKELQAKIVVKECYKFINADEELCGTKTRKGLFTIKDYKSEIECNLTTGLIKALGRDTDSIDGFRPYFGSVDEYHKHKTNQMYKLLTGGMKKLKSGLVSVITTAGFELNSPCKELYDFCVQILHGVSVDETQFIFIAQLDKDDDPFDEKVWEKANPLWTPETLTSLRADAVKAQDMGGEELKDFLTKSLNIWVQFSDDQYIDMEKWKECESDKTLEDMRGKKAWAGLDLSSGGDLTSLSLVFPYYNNEGNKKYFVHSHSFMPKLTVQEHIKTDRAPYDMWIREKLITVTETLSGIKTDYKYIIQYLKNLISEYDIDLQVICYDPHNASAFLYDLEDLGYDSIPITQTAKSLNDATVDFRLEVKAGNVEYDKRNKLLTWSVVNAKTVSNSYGEIKVNKDLKQKRIDPVDAVIDAWKAAMQEELDLNQYITDEYLDKLGW